MHPSHLGLSVVLALSSVDLPGQTGTWMPVAPPPPVSPAELDLAYDAAMSQVVGVTRTSASTLRFFFFDGASWVSTRIFPGRQASIAYDTARSRSVVVITDGGGFVDTWVESMGIWTQLSTPTRPVLDNASHELVYDSMRDRMVLQLCRLDSVASRTETWEFDGQDWALRTTGGPTPRVDFEMAYDEARGQAVLFGGWVGRSPASDETWEWDGQVWRQFLTASPPERRDHVLAFDPSIDRVVLYGGAAGSSAPRRDTWIWDGASWDEVATPMDAGTQLSAGLVFDPTVGHLLLAGNQSGGGTYALTVTLPVQPSVASFGVGCTGSFGTPSLVSTSGSFPYVNESFSMVITPAGGSAFQQAIGLIGLSDQSLGGLPLPLDLGPIGFVGCSLYVSADATQNLPSFGGAASWMVPFPNDVGLAGAQIFFQGVVLDPGGPSGGAAFSNALAATIGLR